MEGCVYQKYIVGFLPEDKFGIHDLVSPKLLWLWWDNVDPLCDAGQGGGSVGRARNVGPGVVSLQNSNMKSSDKSSWWKDSAKKRAMVRKWAFLQVNSVPPVSANKSKIPCDRIIQLVPVSTK